MRAGDDTTNRLPEDTVKIREVFVEADRRVVRMPGGFFTVCAWCEKVRDDLGYWRRPEAYMLENSYGRVSHGICPDCALKFRAEM